MSAYGTPYATVKQSCKYKINNKNATQNNTKYDTKKQENKESHDHLLNQISQAWKQTVIARQKKNNHVCIRFQPIQYGVLWNKSSRWVTRYLYHTYW